MVLSSGSVEIEIKTMPAQAWQEGPFKLLRRSAWGLLGTIFSPNEGSLFSACCKAMGLTCNMAVSFSAPWQMGTSIFTHSVVLSFLKFPVFHYHFLSVWGVFLNHSLKVGLLVTILLVSLNLRMFLFLLNCFFFLWQFYCNINKSKWSSRNNV